MSPPSLAEVWPDTEAGLRRSYYFWGVRGELVDELVQEVAERVVKRTVERGPFPSAVDLRRWARRVARNVLIGHYRRRQPDLLGELEDFLVDGVDVGLEVEAKLRLEAVRRDLASLAELDQHAITRRLNGIRASSSRERNYWAVRYRRARTRLEELVEGVAVAVAVRFQRWRARLEVVAVSAAAAAVVTVAPAVVPVIAAGLRPAVPAVAPPSTATDEEPPAPIAASESPEERVAAPSASPASQREPVPGGGRRPHSAPELRVGVAGPGGRPAVDAVVEQGGPDEHLACVMNPTPPWSPVSGGTVCVGRPVRPLGPPPPP